MTALQKNIVAQWGTASTCIRLAKVLSICWMIFGTYCIAYCQEGKEVLERYLEATGGLKNWSNISSVYKEYSVTQNLDYLGVPDSVKDITKGVLGQRRRCTCVPPYYQVCTDGVWKLLTNGNGSTLSGPGIEPVSLPALTSEFPINYRIQNMLNNESFSFAGVTDINGKKYFTIIGRLEDAEPDDSFLFDADDYLLRYHVSGVNKSISGKFSDYKNFGDLLVATTLKVYHEDIIFQNTRIDSLLFNIKVDSSIFK